MSYDRADYNYDNPSVGARIALFVAWTVLNGLDSPPQLDDLHDWRGRLCRREITPRQFLEGFCDDRFNSQMVNEEGKAFTLFYYQNERSQPGYHGDFERVFKPSAHGPSCPTGTWEDYERLAPIISQRYEGWKRHSPLTSRGWWPFGRRNGG